MMYVPRGFAHAYPDAGAGYRGDLPSQRILRTRRGAWHTLESTGDFASNGRSSRLRFPEKTRAGPISILFSMGSRHCGA